MQALLQELVYDAMPDGAVWPFDRAYIRPPHFHGQLECLLVTRGTATLQLGTNAAMVRDGQLCWILPGVPHVMGDFSADFDMWVIQLDSALVESCWHVASAATIATHTIPSRRGPSPWVKRLAGRAIVDVAGCAMRELSDLAAAVWHAAQPATARRALRELSALALRVTLASVDQRRALSLAELASCLLLSSPATDRRAAAAELGVSEGFLSRTVHRDLGVTFVEQRARTRVAHFLALARQGHLNLLGAALDAGFGSYSQFHRIFTRVSGSRPRDYLQGGRQRTALLVSGDQHQPLSGSVVALPDEQRQRAPL